jgi:VWFA-related protein
MTRVLLTALLAAALVAAQAAGEQTIAVDVDLVNIYFTVCTKKGRLLSNLPRERFTIFEDDQPQRITNFSRETDLPLTIVLLIDTSGSVRYKLDFEQEAAIDFLQSTLRRGRDQAAIFTFNSSLNLRQDYTDDPQLLASAVRRIHAGGGTGLYDALYFLLEGTLAEQTGRRGIILLTDGDDNSSRSSPRDVVDAAQRNNVAIYAISVNSLGIGSSDSARFDRVMEMFGRETGGNAFFPIRLKELSAYFKEISNELRSQYTIAYRSTNPNFDGSFRKIRIEVDNAQYSVRTRAGYFAPVRVTTASR